MTRDGWLFDEQESEAQRFTTALERYGHFPVTVWEIDMQNAMTKTLKKAYVDAQGRDLQRSHVIGTGTDVSEFNPQVASLILNMFAPREGVCFDPFAGGGTRAIFAAAHGLEYHGTELLPAQAEATLMKILKAGYADGCHIYIQDARDATRQMASDSADFIYTCPPYYDMEVYSDQPDDLSRSGGYQEFLASMRRVVAECYRIARPGCYACWVVGLHRDKHGRLLPMNHDFARLHRDVGWHFMEEVVLYRRSDGSVQRVGNFEKGNRLLIRQHEYCLVFRKGRHHPGVDVPLTP